MLLLVEQRLSFLFDEDAAENLSEETYVAPKGRVGRARRRPSRRASVRLLGGRPRSSMGRVRSTVVPRTLFDRIWESHVVREDAGEPALLYVDLHLIHEVTSAQAFDGLRLAGRHVRRPELSLATMDHNVPTVAGPVRDPLARAQLEALRANCAEFGDPLSMRPGAGARASCT